MGYLHIDNLYKNTEIFLFKECYAMEKVHGTSAHLSWTQGMLHYSSGGATHMQFIKLFDEDALKEAFDALGYANVVVFGEAYGGKMQKMKDTYGPDLRFIVFDVKVGDVWLSVPNAEDVAKKLGLDFVPYFQIPADLDRINVERDRPSDIAIRLGIGDDKLREGVVLRPLIELTRNDGKRIIVKHKGDAFKERVNAPKVDVDPAKLEVLEKAQEIAFEWVTDMRLDHVTDKLVAAKGSALDVTDTGGVVKAMTEDVLREAEGEIVDSKDARKAISQRAAKLFKQRVTRI